MRAINHRYVFLKDRSILIIIIDGMQILNRISAMNAAGLYDKWLKDAMPNGTACLNTPRNIVVQEPFSIQGLWVRTEIIAGY